MASKTDPEKRVIALSSGLGSLAIVFDDDDVLDLLRAAVLIVLMFNALLNGKRRVSGVIVKALGLRKVYVVE
jgi:hypothetical protein